ncbi:hypothetical protein Hdeb2414_s0027g00695301 [Helianthus debilis subsp. tardiflorus]
MEHSPTTQYLRLLDDLSTTDCVIPINITSTLLDYALPIYRSEREKKYSEPMVWIGLYIACASLVCILTMVADLLHGMRRGKLWFPCKYFRINSAFLTVISVAMKLPVDLSGSMPGDVDQVAKLGSMAFMCTMMANLLPCLSTMDNNALWSNITALCLLVITMVVNICIQIQTGVVSYKEVAPIMNVISYVDEAKINKDRNIILASIYVTLLLWLLVVHVCTCLAILKSKKIIESKYQQGHDRALEEIKQSSGELLTVEQLQKHVKNHWIMAGSGSPQFITACFHTTSASGEGFVVVCKILALIPFVFMICVVYCFRCLKWLFNSSLKRFSSLLKNHFKWEQFNSSDEKIGFLERNDDDLRPYVLQLEDEMELANRTLEGLSKSVNRLIQNGEKSKANDNLMKLIEQNRASDFQGVAKFDNVDEHHMQHVPFLLLKVEYQNCWSLPVVTLTTIAISLPEIEREEVDNLLKGVNRGLRYVKLVEENLNATNDFVSVQEAAKTLWKEVDIDHKWLGHKLQDPSFQVKTTRQIVEWFRDTSENLVYSEVASRKDDSKGKSMCANSMYRITKTILSSNSANNDDKASQKELFDNLSSMIADIMAACLTNLPQVIEMKCHTSAIEIREASVKEAARLLGESKEIIETLQRRCIPSMNPSDLPFIDKWRAIFKESLIP